MELTDYQREIMMVFDHVIYVINCM